MDQNQKTTVNENDSKVGIDPKSGLGATSGGCTGMPIGEKGSISRGRDGSLTSVGTNLGGERGEEGGGGGGDGGGGGGSGGGGGGDGGGGDGGGGDKLPGKQLRSSMVLWL